jgi:hypothetical protein
MRSSSVRSATALGLVALLFAGASSCSSEQRRDVEGATVRVALEADTKSVLDVENIELDGQLDCSADISDDDVVTGTCEGTDTDGNDVRSSVDGTVDVDKATCDSVFVVTVAGDVVIEDKDHDCLD